MPSKTGFDNPEVRQVYKILVEANGEWVSRGEIGTRTGILRRLVQNRIQAIRQELGYDAVESKRNRGYRLQGGHDA